MSASGSDVPDSVSAARVEASRHACSASDVRREAIETNAETMTEVETKTNNSMMFSRLLMRKVCSGVIKNQLASNGAVIALMIPGRVPPTAVIATTQRR